MRLVRLAALVPLISGSVVLVSAVPRAAAQGTTATLRGTVTSADDGAPMAEVEVTLTDAATGITKTATTRSDGGFAFTNLPVGGPYQVTAQVGGFKPATEKEIFLNANKTRDISLAMKFQEEVIEVEGSAVTRSTSNRTVISAAEIQALPSVGRDPRDVVRRNPEVSVEGSARTLSVGGANSRFNSITVDGIRQDDDFGLTLSGYPTRRSPISLSAIQELAVESSPFDVHYSKFLGGSVNIVTKSGTNEFAGTLVGTYSGDALLGSRSRDNHVKADYSEYRYGATVGGPIIKDKLHFLASVEGLDATTPVSVGSADSDAAIKATRVSQAALDEVTRIAREVYNFDAGAPSRSVKEGDLKLLGKLDWAIDNQHRASVTYQRTGGNNITPTTPRADGSTLPLTSNWYDARDTLNTFSGRLFSDWSDQLSTNVEVNAKLVSSTSPPLNGNGFMQATIATQETRTDPSTGGSIILGPESNRHANELDNDVLRSKAEVNYLTSGNLITAGLEYEQLRIRNLFVPGSFGIVSYASIEDFMNKLPSAITYTNATTLNAADGAAKWNVGTWSGYAQDQIKVNSELSVLVGARLEVYQTTDRITRNQNFVNRYASTLGIQNTETLNGRSIVLPRLGVSYLPTDRLNLRAGVGLYSGGTPSVWVSNGYSNDGVRISTVNSSCPTTNPDPAQCAVLQDFNGRDIPQPLKDRVAAGNGDVDLLDPNFNLPSSWKASTGADYSLDIPGANELGKNIELKANYTFTKVKNGVNWVDLRRDLQGLANAPNNTPVGTTPDGRPLYAANFNVSRGSDVMLTNTTHGHGHVASVQVQKGFPFGLFVSGSYAYQNVWEVSPATSSRSVSNYGQSAVVDPNNPANGVSNYERRHRYTAAAEYSHPVVGYFTDSSPWKNMKTSFGMFMESRSGQPFSWTFGATEVGRDAPGTKLGRIFGETTTFAQRNRELFYVPTEAETCVGMLGATDLPAGCKVVLSTGANGLTPERFNTFLKQTGLDKYRGRIVPRNAFSSPWYTRIDARFAQDLPNPLSGQRAQVFVDIENAGNLLNRKWGRLQSAPFPYTSPAVDLDYDRTNNKYVYSNVRSPNPTTVDLLQSVWRISIGVMYDF